MDSCGSRPRHPINRGWNDGAARVRLLEFFESWGSEEPVTGTARRRLSSILFS